MEGKLLLLQFIFGSVLRVLGVQFGHYGLFPHKPCAAGKGVCQDQSQKLQLSHILSLLVFCFHKCCSISFNSHVLLFLPRPIITYVHDCLCISFISAKKQCLTSKKCEEIRELQNRLRCFVCLYFSRED